MLVTEGRWWKREADRDGCTVSSLCCAESDLTFKLPTLSDLSPTKHNYVLPGPKTASAELWVAFTLQN